MDKLEIEGHQVTSYRRNMEIPDLSGYDIIYHIAGVLGKRGLPLSVYRAAHYDLTKHILDKMNKSQKIIFMSSAYVEDARKPYEMTKLEGELLVQKSGFDYAVIRPSFIYGPGDLHHLPVYRWINKLQNLFPILGDGKSIAAPLYIDDLINVLIRAHELRNIISVAGEHLTMNEYLAKIAEALSVRKPHIHIPDFVIYHELFHGDFFTLSHPFKSDFATSSMEEGLKKTVSWYKQNNYL